MRITEYTIHATINKKTTIAIVSDLHGRPFESVKQAFSRRNPDIIAITGDLSNGSITGSVNGLAFLEFAVGIAPTFYSLGNHERKFGEEDKLTVNKIGVTLLDDEVVQFGDINIGGLTSGFIKHKVHVKLKDTPEPNIRWLIEYSRLKGYKILLCHHPEYYCRYIRDLPIDLVLSGHAHGGQIRLFGQGLFAPGQGVFPKYTSGIYDKRLIVSRGLANTSRFVPRIFNEEELIYITLLPAAEVKFVTADKRNGL